jgi:hypothetical protein
MRSRRLLTIDEAATIAKAREYQERETKKPQVKWAAWVVE